MSDENCCGYCNEIHATGDGRYCRQCWWMLWNGVWRRIAEQPEVDAYWRDFMDRHHRWSKQSFDQLTVTSTGTASQSTVSGLTCTCGNVTWYADLMQGLEFSDMPKGMCRRSLEIFLAGRGRHPDIDARTGKARVIAPLHRDVLDAAEANMARKRSE